MPRREPLESTRTRALLSHLRAAFPGVWTKIHGGPFQPRVVDIIGCYCGRYIALEVKRPHRTPTPTQRAFLRRVKESGGIAGVVWTIDDCNLVIGRDNLIRTLTSSTASVRIQVEPCAGRKSERKGTMATKTRGRRSAVVEEELEDLEDLDDLDEEDEDEDVEEDEDEEEDEVPVKSKARSKVKPSKSKPAAPTATKRGNPENLTPRRLPDGMFGVKDIADQLEVEPKIVRVHLRKLEIGTTEGVYQWKPGSSAAKDVVKKVKASIAGK